ncbi:transposable element Tc1 transposase [Trichonephila clavipes]|nr:transposable element Tc1 transposase [Trichonephila clavipes]
MLSRMGGQWQISDGSGKPKATADLKYRLIVRSGVTAPDSPLSTIRRVTRKTIHRWLIDDESHFQLCPYDHRRRVWKRSGQRANPAFTIARHRGPQPGVISWGTIYFDSRTSLVVIRGTLTAQRYVNDILRTVLLPFLLQ